MIELLGNIVIAHRAIVNYDLIFCEDLFIVMAISIAQIMIRSPFAIRGQENVHRIMTWISNYILAKSYVITHSCPSANGGLGKSPLN